MPDSSKFYSSSAKNDQFYSGDLKGRDAFDMILILRQIKEVLLTEYMSIQATILHVLVNKEMFLGFTAISYKLNKIRMTILSREVQLHLHQKINISTNKVIWHSPRDATDMTHIYDEHYLSFFRV